MLSMTVRTTRQPEAVRQAADHYFHDDLGLDGSGGDGTLTFRGTDGYVTVELSQANGETVVDLTTREYEHFVREFARDLR